jgi:dTDP-glucose 4,6-dehydratase
MVFNHLLVTGGCGFIGSNFIREALQSDFAAKITNLDALTYAGNQQNLADLQDESSYSLIVGSITDADLVGKLFAENEFDAIINFAAETHVDRSILGPQVFLQTNLIGTQVLLDAALRNKVPRYLQISTDEVYGALGAEGLFTENTPLAPNSPYSASKASADLLVRSYHQTFGQDVLTTRCSNNYGPYQFPEKLIPLVIANALADKPIPVYGDGMQIRDWIEVRDHCRALMRVLEAGKAGEIYNIGGNSERTNLVVVKSILQALDKPESLIEYVTDRPGHDRRYAIDGAKIESELDFTPTVSFEQGIKATVNWYLDHRPWWQALLQKRVDIDFSG